MLRFQVVRIGFLLGVSLLLAAIIYFFAANWGGLDRIQKIMLSGGLVLLFYGVSYGLSHVKAMLGHHTFMSNVLLVGGCISFGAAVAMLGQTYNSHADSYELFLVWSVPALLLAWITRYNPFYLLSYVLVHFAIWFYFYPTSLSVNHSEQTILVIGGVFIALNLILFSLTEMNVLKSIPIKIISLIVFYFSSLLLTDSYELETYGVWMNIPYVVAIGLGFYYFAKVRLNKTMLTLQALATSAFAVYKFFELASRHASSGFFVLGLVFVALLLTGNVLFFKQLNKLGASRAESEHQPDKDPSDERSSAIVGKVVSTIVTVIGVIIGSISLIGLVLLATDGNDPQYVLFVLALLFVVPMILLPRFHPVVRYTLLTIGYISGLIAIVWIDNLGLSVLFLIASAAGWLRMEGRIQRFITMALININLAAIFFQLLDRYNRDFEWVVLILTVVNTAVFASHFLFRDGALRRHIKESGLFFSLLFLFWLTFFDNMFPYSYTLFNLVNFVVVTVLVFAFIRRNEAWEASISLTYWFLFLGFKYYDLLWKLLHKSITLALLGIIALAVTYMMARRTGTDASDEGPNGGFMRKSIVMIAVVVLLQIGYLGYKTVQSESLLKNGSIVKLQIEPLDPRSLLQGDYVRLNYSISTLPQAIADQLEQEDNVSRLKVVLVPDSKGIHVFDRIYRSGEKLADGEIVINGKWSGYQRIYYGIETYFVPEGTGLEVERNAVFAYVRVSASGNALLERLEVK